jgi:serine/threonine protein kinase
MTEISESLLNQRYQLKTCLAQGTDNATYDAIDTNTNQACIVKALQLGQLEQWKRLELFRREARILGNLEHPQIPILLDYFESEHESGKNVYLVTEKAPGIELSKRIQEGIGLSEEFCYLTAVQILNILIYLHGINPPVIHRDIKPSNLLLDDNGCIYLIDFGGVQDILRPIGGGGSTIIGTYGFMAPEQFNGRALPQTDLYGLGATLVYLLSGLEPSQLPNPGMLIDFRPFVQASDRFCHWVEQLILPSLEQRFYSAEEALAVLNAILPVYARTLSLPAIQKATSQAVVRRSVTEFELNNEQNKPSEKTSSESWVQPLGTILKENYQIEKILAVGSSSVTYLAKSLSLTKEVVLKELHFKRLDTWKGYQLFEREMKTLELMRHPRTPRLLEYFELEQSEHRCFYIVTSLLPGILLSERLKNGWRPNELTVRRFAEKMLDILVDLHEKEPLIVHRDIKPSNILIDDQNLPYLIDFGAVQDALREKGGGGSTVIGTFGYMAPEQFLGQATPQSDLYGLGATVLHILSGRGPSEMVHSDGLGLQFEELINCSQGLKWWLERMLAPDLSKRMGTAREARRILEHLDEMRVGKELVSDFPFKPDPAIQIEELPEKQILKLMPTYHDYKIQMRMLFFLNLVLVPMFLTIPELGGLLALSTLVGSGLLITKHRNEGQKTHMQIEVSAQGLWVNAWRELADGSAETLETIEIPLQHIDGISLNHLSVNNRLQVRTKTEGSSVPLLKKTQLPIAGQLPKANYLIEKLTESIHIYQNRLKRLQAQQKDNY